MTPLADLYTNFGKVTIGTSVFVQGGSPQKIKSSVSGTNLLTLQVPILPLGSDTWMYSLIVPNIAELIYSTLGSAFFSQFVGGSASSEYIPGFGTFFGFRVSPVSNSQYITVGLQFYLDLPSFKGNNNLTLTFLAYPSPVTKTANEAAHDWISLVSEISFTSSTSDSTGNTVFGIIIRPFNSDAYLISFTGDSLKLMSEMIEAFQKAPIKPNPTSPQFPGTTNTTGGGTGDFDNTSVPVNMDPISHLSGANLISGGFLTSYCPTTEQLQNIKRYLWSKNLIQGLVQLIPGQDPMKYIIGAHIVPLSQEQIPHALGIFSFGVSGEIDVTRPNTNYVTSQFVDVDIGEIDITEFQGGFSDYSPYTTYGLYLPYIGMRDLGADIITNKTIRVRYRIDVITGACTAYVLDGENILYTYSGNVANQVPIQADNAGMFYSAIATAAAGIATFAIGMPMLAGALGGAGMVGEGASFAAGTIAKNAPQALSIGSRVMSPILNKNSGGSDANVGAGFGITNTQSVYLFRTRPNQSVPEDFQSVKGYLCNASQAIGDFTGFTQFSDFHLEGIPALPDEIAAISNLLKEGIIL